MSPAGPAPSSEIGARGERDRAVLADRARALARPLSADPVGRTLALVVFGIGGVAHAVEATSVCEVLRHPSVTAVPWAPAALVGVANVRGELIAVADISELVGAPPPARPGPVLVVDGPGSLLGLVVDGVPDLSDVETHSILPLPGNGAAAGPAPAGLLAGTTADAVVVLSVPALLSDPRLSATETRSH